MPTILTVEDSRAVRNVIARQVRELGFDLEQAENGEQGLERLQATRVDLVLLDVTMPVLDGPGMLERMRSAGNRTPVIMLTSESKRSIVEDTLRLGISDYVLKPFANEELRTKIISVLGEAPAPSKPAPAPVSAPVPAPAKSTSDDVLILDDVDNVAKKLRTLVPASYAVEHCLTAKMALRLCRERAFKLVLVDADLPADGEADVRNAAFVAQFHSALPKAGIVALCLRTTNDPSQEMKALGYAGVLFKPFKQEPIDELVAAHLVEQEEVLTRQQDVLTLGALTGKADLHEGYFARLASSVPAALEQIAAACHEHVVADLRKAPVDAKQFSAAVTDIARRAGQIGLGAKLVVSEAGRKVLSAQPDAKRLFLFDSIDAARVTEVDPNAFATSEPEPAPARDDTRSWIARMQDL
jgi:DNA-binding response OmpR family regulator